MNNVSRRKRASLQKSKFGWQKVALLTAGMTVVGTGSWAAFTLTAAATHNTVAARVAAVTAKPSLFPTVGPTLSVATPTPSPTPVATPVPAPTNSPPPIVLHALPAQTPTPAPPAPAGLTDILTNPTCQVPSNAVPAQGKVIIISLECQQLTAYGDAQPVVNGLTTTGRPALATPKGTFSVLRKNHPFRMVSEWPKGSPYYYNPSWVQYVLWFTNQGHGIHDASWQPDSTLGPGSQNNNSIASHGCVHLTLANIKALYDWADIGTPVLIY